jgi:hypothetical protein
MALIDNPVSDTIQAVLGVVQNVINRIWPDPARQAEAQFKLTQLKLIQNGELARMTNASNLALAQINVNNTEAQSNNLFKSGWRPAVGWVCVTACGWNWIGLPIVKTGLILFAKYLVVTQADIALLQPASLTEMMPVLFGLLGIGYLRTQEKLQGAA